MVHQGDKARQYQQIQFHFKSSTQNILDMSSFDSQFITSGQTTNRLLTLHAFEYSPPASPRTCQAPTTSHSYSSSAKTLVPLTPLSYTSSSSPSSITSASMVLPNISPSLLWKINNINHNSINSAKSTIRDYPTNEVEFARLPAAVRRKQFSTLERLRLAQHSSHVVSCASGSRRSMASIKKSHLRRSRDVISLIVPGNQSRAKLRRETSTKTPNMTLDPLALSVQDVKWFLQLPETVKRKHFTPVEREILQSRCEGIMAKSEHQPLVPIGVNQQTLPLATNDHSEVPIDDHYATTHTGELQENEFGFRHTISWLDDKEDLASKLTLNNYEDALKPAGKALIDKAIKGHSRMPSLRRTISLSRNSTTNLSNYQDGNTPTTKMKPSHRPSSHSVSIPNRRPYHHHSNRPSLDHDAAYWQDPDARLKLRLYLASPQKFDEAVEFGFPASTESDEFYYHAPTSPQYTEIVLEDGSSSSSTTSSESRTRKPSTLTLRTTTPRPLSSIGPGIVSPTSPFSKPRSQSAFPLDLGSGREMTLRMTLTRPDLRATETELYGWQHTDPYALDDLPPATNDVNGLSGPFEAPTGPRRSITGLSKFWRKVKSGPRR